MNDHLFTTDQTLVLIKLLLAHFIADFTFQSTAMVSNKKWFSFQMLMHVLIVFICTLLLSQLFFISLVITLLHWITDGIKTEVGSNFKESTVFILDQIIHIFTIIIVWFFYFNMHNKIFDALYYPLQDYNISLILLAYIWIIYPVGYLIKFAVKNIIPISSKPNEDTETKVEHGGRLIGIFERIIILTFVLLNQYEAIGFLITGKSIIRFADNNSNLKSEYVLVGTMMSYGIAIVTGVLINYLINNV